MTSLAATQASSLLLADRHRGIERILGDVEALAARRSFSTASKRFAELDKAIGLHARAEEDVWLPQIERRWPELAAKLATVIDDHRALSAQINRVRDAFAASDPKGALAALATLRELIEAHHAREEELVYPAVVALHASKPR